LVTLSLLHEQSLGETLGQLRAQVHASEDVRERSSEVQLSTVVVEHGLRAVHQLIPGRASAYPDVRVIVE